MLEVKSCSSHFAVFLIQTSEEKSVFLLIIYFKRLLIINSSPLMKKVGINFCICSQKRRIETADAVMDLNLTMYLDTCTLLEYLMLLKKAPLSP